MDEIIIRYIHFISFMCMFATVVATHMLLKPTLKSDEIRRLNIINNIFTISTVAAVFTGYAMWMYVGKPANFYSKNGLFHIKMFLVFIIILLSLPQTLFYLKSRQDDYNEVKTSSHLIKLLRAELLILCGIPLFGIFIAKGIHL